MTKDWSDKLMDAHMEGCIIKTKLKSLENTLPEISKTFDETMEYVFEMTAKLMKKVKEFQEMLPTDGSMGEGVGNQALLNMVETGSAMIRKSVGLMERGI